MKIALWFSRLSPISVYARIAIAGTLFFTGAGMAVVAVGAVSQEGGRAVSTNHRDDPCDQLPDPPGNAYGIDKKCPPAGSSAGVAKGDFNGDGYADLAIGEPGATIAGQSAAGDVYVIYGSANGLTLTKKQLWYEGPDRNVPGNPAVGDLFGSALASGDFNGDGFSDLAIGIPGKTVTFQGTTYQHWGRVVIIYGSADGLTTTSTTVPAPQSFDLSKHFFLRGGHATAGANLGQALAWGDFNNDGAGDLAIGAPKYTLDQGLFVAQQSEAGAVWILYGKKKTATTLGGLTTVSNVLLMADDLAGHDPSEDETSVAGDHFGWALTSGDFDGDTFFDLAIGAPDKQHQSQILGTPITENFRTSGTFYILSGTSLGIDPTIKFQFSYGLERPGIRMGAALAAGDFNGDGKADLAVGAPHEMDENPFTSTVLNFGGTVLTFYGSSTGLGSAINDVCSHCDEQTLGGIREADDQFGLALAAGDFNGDGKVDLAIGTPLKNVSGFSDAGEVYVVYGSGSGLSKTIRSPQHLFNLSGLQSGARFGSSLTAWNFGHDESFTILGHPVLIKTADLAIGVPYRTVSGVSGAGEVDVLYGTSTFSSNGLIGGATDQIFTANSFGTAAQGFGGVTGGHFGSTLY